jgi:hypothetical protein
VTRGFYWAQNKVSLDMVVVECDENSDFLIPGAGGVCYQYDFFYEWFLGPGPIAPPENQRSFREMWRPAE